MLQCKWDPSKHNGQACPVHGAGGQSSNGHKIRINGGKYQMKLSDDSDWEEISSEEYNDLREGGYQEFDETIDDDFGFDEMDEDAIWDAFDAGEINEEERNKLLSERSGQIANVDARPNEFKPDESKRVKTGIDSQNRAYVQSSDGNRQYFASEKEAKDYANRMNEAQGLNDKPDATKYEGAEVIGGDDDNEGMLKNKTPLTKDESNNLDPNNPKYEGKSRSAITNAKLVDEGYEFTNADGEKIKESIIEYIPYGALQDGDNRKLYGIVRNYDGSDSPDIGAIVSPNLEDAKEQLESQVKLGIQGSDRYLKRGKYDEGFFNILRDYADDNDADDVETRKRYSEKYGWDYNKPFAEHDFMKDDPYEKWKSERETSKQSKIDNGTMEFIDNIAKKNSVNKEDYEKLKKSLVETFEEILRKQGK